MSLYSPPTNFTHKIFLRCDVKKEHKHPCPFIIHISIDSMDMDELCFSIFFFNTKTYLYKENQQHFRFPDIGNIDSWASNKPVASSTTLVNVNSPMIGATNCTNFWQREPFLYSPSKGVRFDYSGIVMCTFWWIENCCSGRVKDVIMLLIYIT